METYELEKTTYYGEDGYYDRIDEESIAVSNSIPELEKIAKTIKLKGNRYFNQELRIIRKDESGDIHYERFIER